MRVKRFVPGRLTFPVDIRTFHGYFECASSAGFYVGITRVTPTISTFQAFIFSQRQSRQNANFAALRPGYTFGAIFSRAGKRVNR